MTSITPERVAALVPMLAAQGVSLSTRNTVIADKAKIAAALQSYDRSGELGDLPVIADKLQARFDPPQTGRRAVALLAKELMSPEAALGIGLTTASEVLAQQPPNWQATLADIREAWTFAIAAACRFDMRRIAEHQAGLGNYKQSTIWRYEMAAAQRAGIPEPDARDKERYAELLREGEPEARAKSAVKTLCTLMGLDGCETVDVHQLHAVFADESIRGQLRLVLDHCGGGIELKDLPGILHQDLDMPAPVTWDSIYDDRIRLPFPVHGPTGEWQVPVRIWEDSIAHGVRVLWPSIGHFSAARFAEDLRCSLGIPFGGVVTAANIRSAIIDKRSDVERLMKDRGLLGRPPEALLVNERLASPVPPTWPGFEARVTNKPIAHDAPWALGVHITEAKLAELFAKRTLNAGKTQPQVLAREVLEAMGVSDFGWNAQIAADDVGRLASKPTRIAVNRALRGSGTHLDADDLLDIVCGRASKDLRYASLEVPWNSAWTLERAQSLGVAATLAGAAAALWQRVRP